MELQVIKLAQYYRDHPDKEEEVFEKVAIGFLQPLMAAGRAGLTAAKSSLGSSLAAKGGAKGLMQSAKGLPGRTWQGYKRLWNQDPLGTGVNTLMLGSMIKGGSERPSTLDFLQARQDLKESMLNYILANEQDKPRYKQAALNALRIMGH